MDIKQLKYFLTIVEEGQITAAAKRLNISQPPLSLQLKLLEEELGVILFKRNSRNLELTEAGLILQHKSEQLISLFTSTINELKDLNEGTKGTLNIGTVGSAGVTILPQKIYEFNKKYPNITFQVWEGGSFRITELLNNGVIDIGFVREPFNTNKYNSLYIQDKNLEKEFNDLFVTIAKPKFYENIEKNTIPLNDLKDKPLIIHRRFHNIIEDACAEKGFVPKIICENDEIMSSLSWAKVGIGIAIVPFTSSNLIPDVNLKIKKIIEPSIESKSALIWISNKYISTIARHFIKSFDKNIKF
ncbi:transcriptional regulator, LysR family [Clostridium sp. DL-VIII]|uniref:LysR family transcriptional regulator n=1 Tax=Clostridium sp. DL-VIII TaxID=641107 RepID=UPI00023AF2CE|nr:LysR family transcriptional regulator [Clostridium sp. DL-VIII]EHI97711.1 transcriptional regulator, LysR family [Clostridium sp. DL-VIII]